MILGAFIWGAMIAGVPNLFPLERRRRALQGTLEEACRQKRKFGTLASRSAQRLMKMGDGASCVRSEGELTCSTLIRNGQL